MAKQAAVVADVVVVAKQAAVVVAVAGWAVQVVGAVAVAERTAVEVIARSPGASRLQ